MERCAQRVVVLAIELANLPGDCAGGSVRTELVVAVRELEAARRDFDALWRDVEGAR